jgi:5'-nucleotidase
VDFYNAQAAPFAQREVSKISADITRQRNAAGESGMGDLIADAQLAATRAPERGGAQIAFMNQGGIRTDLRADRGFITYNDLFSVHPFGNGVVTLSLTGKQIHEALELQWSAANSMLQVSDGFSYEWDGTAPLGQRVKFGSIRFNGSALEASRVYRVTVNEFLAQGGDGFAVFPAGADQLRGVTDVAALEAYVAAHTTPLAPPVGGRIKRLDEQSAAEATKVTP